MKDKVKRAAAIMEQVWEIGKKDLAEKDVINLDGDEL